MKESYEKFMKLAIEGAAFALQEDELPVGAIIVMHGRVCAKGRRTANGNTRLDHGEMKAIREALDKNHKLANEMTIYTTLEPCMMCFGAILNSRIKKVVYALEDPYGGATCLTLNHMPKRHQIKFPEIIGGILREEARELFKEFFKTTDKTFWKNNPTNPLVKICFK